VLFKSVSNNSISKTARSAFRTSIPKLHSTTSSYKLSVKHRTNPPNSRNSSKPLSSHNNLLATSF
jgi:hypothetical protein